MPDPITAIFLGAGAGGGGAMVDDETSTWGVFLNHNSPSYAVIAIEI
jgi:hypothetical protein